MADTLMGLDEVAKELQLDKEQVVELVKKGMLRGFMDQKTYKFRSPDVDAYKKKLTSSATRLSEEKKDATSKVDLAEIESDAGIEESDQTSVLAPADDAEDHLTAKPEETPVFQFSDKELGLEEEDGSGLEEADQTSLMAPAEEVKEEAKKEEPAFDFDTKGMALEDESSHERQPVVSEDSESSVDILDVADESSSESSASTMDLSDESGTGENVVVLTDIEESPKPMPPVAAKDGAKGKDSATTTVSDLLGQAEEGSEEELETLDIEEVAETGDIPLEQGEKTAPDTTDTVPIADEAETVGIAEAATAADETKFGVGDTIETAGVSDAVPEAAQEAAGPEAAVAEAAEAAEEAAEEGAEQHMVAPIGWEMVTPSPLYNGCMIAAAVLLIIGCAFIICDANGIQNSYTQQVVDALKGISFP